MLASMFNRMMRLKRYALFFIKSSNCGYEVLAKTSIVHPSEDIKSKNSPLSSYLNDK